MKEQITYDIFEKIDIRLGTVLSVKKNEKARKPSLVVEVDFGNEIGVKTSSAQITHFYSCLLYTSPSPRDIPLSRMPSSA